MRNYLPVFILGGCVGFVLGMLWLYVPLVALGLLK